MEASPAQSTKAKQSSSNSISGQVQGQDSDLEDSVSQPSIDSDVELDRTTYSQRKVITINSVLFRLISKFQAQRLRSLVKSKALISFGKQFTIIVDHNDQSAVEDVQNFVRNMNDIEFDKKESEMKRHLIHCKALREELKKENYYLMNHAASLYLYGTNKSREQMRQRYRRIISEYYESRYQDKKIFSRTEREAYETIFKCLKNFDKLVKNTDDLLKVEPFFLREKHQKNQGNLMFFLKMKKKMEIKKLTNDVIGAMKKCKFLLFFVNKNPKQVKENKKYAVRFYYDKKINKNYLIVAYRKKDISVQCLPSVIQQILDQHQLVIEGFRFFSDELSSKASLQKISEFCKNQPDFKDIDFFPKQKPYSISVTLKLYTNQLNHTQKLLLALAVNGKIQNQLNFIPPGLTTINQRTKITQNDQTTDNFNFGFVQQQPQQQQPYFKLKQSEKQQFQQNGKCYRRTPIECSKAFLNNYATYQGQQTPILFSGINVTKITEQSYKRWEQNMDILQKPTKSYYEAMKKNGVSKILSMRPLFKVEYVKEARKIDINEQT